ncbi:hypothetical protein C8J56DRAFT_945489 [Mycena floridula]|nr:hypothetical protein C8J56DRAFT_945489 [Mycena floridula]
MATQAAGKQEEIKSQRKRRKLPSARIPPLKVVQPGPVPAGAIPVFSQEIFDLIIDYNYTDRNFIRRCSCVCRAWLPSSRLHFFEGKQADINSRTELQWMSLVRSPLATIGHYIRSVRLEATLVGPLRFEHCLARLDKVEDLHIWGGLIASNSFSPFFSDVKSLSINSRVTYCDDISNFLSSFTQLEKLVLLSSVVNNMLLPQDLPFRNENPDMKHSIPLALRSVSIRESGKLYATKVFLTWYLASPALENVDATDILDWLEEEKGSGFSVEIRVTLQGSPSRFYGTGHGLWPPLSIALLDVERFWNSTQFLDCLRTLRSKLEA